MMAEYSARARQLARQLRSKAEQNIAASNGQSGSSEFSVVRSPKSGQYTVKGPRGGASGKEVPIRKVDPIPRRVGFGRDESTGDVSGSDIE